MLRWRLTPLRLVLLLTVLLLAGDHFGARDSRLFQMMELKALDLRFNLQ